MSAVNLRQQQMSSDHCLTLASFSIVTKLWFMAFRFPPQFATMQSCACHSCVCHEVSNEVILYYVLYLYYYIIKQQRKNNIIIIIIIIVS